MELIDLRSDSVTKPTGEMLDAMRNAKVGYAVLGDDPTVNLLEEKAADILGKGASLFVPSGTFGNQLALLTHTNRGDEVIIPESNHIILYEVGAASVIAGVQLRTLHDHLGRINLKELQLLYREENILYPRTGLICVENAHSSGTVVPLENMKEVYNFSRTVGMPIHLDGARIFNAAAALKVNPKEIVRYCDSVMFCLSKGLCSPIGSMLVGNKRFIEKARKNAKLMGGGMCQVGYLAAAGTISLDKMRTRLNKDHENAKYLASQLEKIEIFEIMKNRLDINIVFFKVNNKSFNESDFIQYLYKHNIKINPIHLGEFRFVTHYWITRRKIDYLTDVIKNYVNFKL